MSKWYMDNINQGESQSVEERINTLIDVVDSFPMFSSAFRVELKTLLAELLPDVRDRNRERVHTIIDAKRDVCMQLVGLDTSLSPEGRMHRKDGVKLQADILKWLLDGIMFLL